jgi:hypothetical protein
MLTITPSIQLIISCEKHPNYMWNGQDTMLKGDYCSQSYVMTNNPIKFEHIHHTVSEELHSQSVKEGRTYRDHYYAPRSQSVRGQRSLLCPSVAKRQRTEIITMTLRRKASEIITMTLRRKASRDHYYAPPSQSVQRQSTKDRDKHCGNVIHNRTKLFYWNWHILSVFQRTNYKRQG